MTLQKNLTKFHLLFISVAAIFGSGWLFAPFYAAQMAGVYSLLAWLIGALISVIIALTMAEVVVLLPKTGGLPAITELTHGKFLALCVIILNLVVFIILPALEIRTIVQYLAYNFSFLLADKNSLSIWGYLLAFSLLGFITLVNLYGGKVTGNLNTVVVILKLVTPLVICAAFLYVIGLQGAFDFSRFKTFLLPSAATVSSSSIPWTQIFHAIATSGIIFSFLGFHQATLYAGETPKPHKAIPFAIFTSLLTTAVIYLLLQYVFLMAVPKESFAAGWSKLAFTGDQSPFLGLAALLGVTWILGLIYVDAVVSPLGTAFSYISAAPRLILGISDSNKNYNKIFRFNKHGASISLIVITLTLECLTFVLLPNIKSMIALLVAAYIFCYSVAPASMLMLRKIKPELHRPFRVPCVHLVALISLCCVNLMLVSCGWVALRNLLCLLGVVVVSYCLLNVKRIANIKSTFVSSGWFVLQLVAIGILCFVDKHYSLSFVQVAAGIIVISVVVLLLSQFKNLQSDAKIV